MRSSAFLWTILGTLLCITVVAAPAAGAYTTPFTRDIVDYLKTRGLLPLWAGITRPMHPWNLRAALDVGRRMQEGLPLSASDQTVLRQLDSAFEASEPSRSGIQYATEASLVAPFGMPRTYTRLSASSGSSALMSGWAVNTPTAVIAANSGGVSWLIGRTSVGWGPAPLGSELSFDEAAGGLDALELSFVWLRARFTKVVGWLDSGRSIVGTRMDIPYRPNLRLGFSDTMLVNGAPYVPYILNPIPVAINPPIMAQFRMPQGTTDNVDLMADMDWVPAPGVRVFGEVFIDDITVPTPTANFPSKWGLTAGFHLVSDDGSSVQGMYTIVLNWTYAEGTPGLSYVLRGLPLGHVLGTDFDLIHFRLMSGAPPASSTWVAYVRKGEGKVGVYWTSQTEAWQKLFLSGVVEHSLLTGFDTPLETSGWTGKFGPWVAYRVNADHVLGATRIDWGVNFEAIWSN